MGDLLIRFHFPTERTARVKFEGIGNDICVPLGYVYGQAVFVPLRVDLCNRSAGVRSGNILESSDLPRRPTRSGRSLYRIVAQKRKKKINLVKGCFTLLPHTHTLLCYISDLNLPIKSAVKKVTHKLWPASHNRPSAAVRSNPTVKLGLAGVVCEIESQSSQGGEVESETL